jgi:hypothetical protein
MSSTAPNTTAAPATAPAATTTKKPASLKAVTGFGQLDPNALAIWRITSLKESAVIRCISRTR